MRWIEGQTYTGQDLVYHLESIIHTDCSDEYRIHEARTKGESEGHSYIELYCPQKQVVEWHTLKGYPTAIWIYFKPGSRIRDMLNAKFSDWGSVNVRLFIEWFKTVLEKKISLEGTEVEWQVFPKKFEKMKGKQTDDEIKIETEEYQYVEWNVFVNKD